MKIQFDEKSTRNLLHCVYLGNYVINANRAPKDTLKGYEELSEEIYKQFLSEYKQIPLELITDNAVAALREKIIDEVSEFLDEYEKIIGIEKTGEIEENS